MYKNVCKAVIVTGCIVFSQVSYAFNDGSNAEWKIDNEFFKQQVQQSLSAGRAVRTLIGHYPQSVTGIVDVALDLYPEQYKEIIHSAVSAQPFSAEDIVTIAVQKGITECESIVEAAIRAEPSYVSFVATAAANASPHDFDDI